MRQIDALEYQFRLNNMESISNIEEVSLVVFKCTLKNGHHVDIDIPGNSIPNAIEIAKKRKTLIEKKIEELKKEFDSL